MMDVKLNSRVNNYIEGLINYGQKMNDPTLMRGKMGLAILYYHLGYLQKDHSYIKVADGLYTDSLSLKAHLANNFDKELLEIGWGICHVLNNDFNDKGKRDRLNDFDKVIVDSGLEGIENFTLDNENGILWYLLYVCERMKLSNKYPIKQSQEFYQLAQLLISKLKWLLDPINLDKETLIKIEYHILVRVLNDFLSFKEYKHDVSEILDIVLSILTTRHIEMSYFNCYHLISVLYNSFDIDVVRKYFSTFTFSEDENLHSIVSSVNSKNLFIPAVLEVILKLVIDESNSNIISSSTTSDINYGFNNGVALNVWMNEFPEEFLMPLSIDIQI